MKSKSLLSYIVLAVCFSTSGISNAQSFSENIISHWTLDETTGTKVTDSKTGATGDVMGTAANWSWGTGIKNNALDFTNSDTTNIAIIEDSEALAPINFANDAFSVSLWVKCSQDALDGVLGESPEQMFFMKGDNGTDGPNGNGMRYAMSSKDGKIYFAVDDNVTKSQLSALPEDFVWPADEWANLVGIRTMGTLEDDVFELHLYLNGELIKTQDDATLEPLSLSDQRLLIGNYHNLANPVHGSIDEVMIINKALSGDEVKELYDSYMVTGIFKNKALGNITIAPNPVSNELIIKNASNLTSLEIYNLSGSLVKKIMNQNSATIRYNISSLAKGQYIVKGYNQNKGVTSGSFVKN